MADDPYSVLGVAKTASAADITKAYRKLAKKLHPDLNPGDKAAEEKFKKVTAAYDIVGDEKKRARYDRGEIDESGQERPQQRYYREYAGGEDAARYRSAAGFEDIGELQRSVRRPVRTGWRRGTRRRALLHARPGCAISARGRLPRCGEGHQDAHHAARRRDARRDDPGGRQRRPGAPPEGQGPSRHGRGRDPAMPWSKSLSGPIPCSSGRATTSSSRFRSPSMRRCSAARSRCRRSAGACSRRCRSAPTPARR